MRIFLRIRFILPNLPRPNAAVVIAGVVLVIETPRPMPNPARYLYLTAAAALVDNSRCICKMAVTRKLCVLVSLTAFHFLVSPLFLLNNLHLELSPYWSMGGRHYDYDVVNIVGGFP